MRDVDVDELSAAIRSVASHITADAVPSHDATGGLVASLTEAVMGITKALEHIASAIESVAISIRPED